MCLRCNFQVLKFFFPRVSLLKEGTIYAINIRGMNTGVGKCMKLLTGWENLREGRDTRGNKSALENFQNSDWPWVLHRWSWLWTAFASTRTGLDKHKDWAWSVIWEKGSNRGLTGPFLLYYYWPGLIFEFNESSSSKWFFSAFLLVWLVKKEHT